VEEKKKSDVMSHPGFSMSGPLLDQNVASDAGSGIALDGGSRETFGLL